MLYETQFYEYLRSIGRSNGTIRLYRQLLTKLKLFMNGRNIGDVTAITETDIQEFAAGLERKNLASQTVYRLLTILKAYFAYLEQAGLVYLSPTRMLRLPKCIRHHYRAYGEVEVRELLDALQIDTPLGLRAKAIIETGYSSALRPREIRSLKVTDIDFAEGRLFIEQSKGKKDRIVPVGGTALYWIARYLSEVRSKFIRNETHNCVFISLVTGRPLSPRGLALAVSEAFTQSGLSPVPLYCLRSTAATNLLDRGMNVAHIGRLLGHASVRTTQFYLHTKHRELVRAIAAGHPRYQTIDSKQEEEDDT